MSARALIVLLLILNLGVALWWGTREDIAPEPTVVLPADAEPLRLLDEPPAQEPGGGAARPAAAAPVRPEEGDADAGGTGADADQAAVPEAAAVAPAAPLPEASRCHAFGPFDDPQDAARAAAALRPAVLRVSVRETRSAPRGWDVRLAGLADRAAAEAMAARLVAAGFSDHYLMPADAAGRVDIALGRFGGEDAARRHRDTLQAAGFDAVEAPIGDGGAVRHWVDVAAGPQADLAVLQRAAAAPQRDAVDCDRFAPSGR